MPFPRRWLIGWAMRAVVSSGLFAGSLGGRLPISGTEILGFATGAACVMLVVRENIWRDGEHVRHAMHQRFAEVLAGWGTRWFEARGSLAERLAAAVVRVDALLASTGVS